MLLFKILNDNESSREIRILKFLSFVGFDFPHSGDYDVFCRLGCKAGNAACILLLTAF
jgi:hypothetical protein